MSELIRLHMAKERLSKLEDILIETLKIEKQTEKKSGKKMEVNM